MTRRLRALKIRKFDALEGRTVAGPTLVILPNMHQYHLCHEHNQEKDMAWYIFDFLIVFDIKGSYHKKISIAQTSYFG